MHDHLPALHELPLSGTEQGYALLAVLIRLQHHRLEEARVLVEALLALGERSVDVVMARAVVANAMGRHDEVLEAIDELDRMDPPVFRPDGAPDDRVRARIYMKARAIFGLTGELDAEGRASLDFYLRQGPPGAGAPPAGVNARSGERS